MGVLFLALDPAIDRLVALKVLRVNNPEVRERFVREARLAARLQHPNIVTVFDVGEHDGQPFIAMEYIPGETLAELITRRAPLPLSRRLELIVDACKGLAYAHKNGIVHRDVKPANLMISRDSGVLKVLDFGIARGIESNLTQVGMLMGTPNYMSPEQLEGSAVDHRSDIFALGLVLYEVLGYRQAFTGETPQAVWHQVASTQPPSLLEFNPTLDPALAGIIDRAIAKNVDERYHDLDRLRIDLQRVIQRLDAEQASATVVQDGHTPSTPSTPAKRSGFARVAERRAAQIAAHVGRAEAALAEGDLDAAQEAVEEAAMVDPHDQRVLALLERVRREQDEREVAGWLKDAEAAIREGALTTAAGLVSRVLQVIPSPRAGAGASLGRAAGRGNAGAHPGTVAFGGAIARAGGGAFRRRRARCRAARDQRSAGLRPAVAAAIALRERVQKAVAARIDEAVNLARAEAAEERFTTALRRLEQLRPRDARVEVARSGNPRGLAGRRSPPPRRGNRTPRPRRCGETPRAGGRADSTGARSPRRPASSLPRSAWSRRRSPPTARGSRHRSCAARSMRAWTDARGPPRARRERPPRARTGARVGARRPPPRRHRRPRAARRRSGGFIAD